MKPIRNIIAVKKDLCDGCGACVDICINLGFHITAIQILNSICEVVDESQCYGQGDCIVGCSAVALFIEKRPAEMIARPMALGY